MATVLEMRELGRFRSHWFWLPSLLPLLAACWAATLPPWIATWVLALALFLTFKIWTLQECAWSAPTRMRLWSATKYVLIWPGMDPRPFLADARRASPPAAGDWVFAAAKAAFGAVLFWSVARHIVPWSPIAAGWVGLIGLAFVLHFGLIHLLALAWQHSGVAVEPLMRWPVLGRSVSDFWGRRWNLAFRDLAQTFFFRPFVGRLGSGGAMMLVFLISGLIHDWAISLPARGGYGLPTLYFLAQGFSILLEKSSVGRRMRLGRGVRGRLFAWVVVAPGAYWLFHPTFIREVILPMMSALNAI